MADNISSARIITEEAHLEWEGRVLVRHYADFFLDLYGIDHHDCVPRAPIQEGTVGAFAGALLATDT